MNEDTMNATAEETAGNTETTADENEFINEFDGETEEDEDGGTAAETEDEKPVSDNETESSEETGEQTEEIELNGNKYTKEQLEYLLSRSGGVQIPPVLTKLARQANMSVEEYLSAVEQNARDIQVAQRIEQLKEQGVETELAEYVARMEQEKALLEQQADEIMNADYQKNAEEARFKAQADAFNKMFPDVDELPDEVIKRIVREEISPIEAYQSYLLKEQQKRLAQIEQQNKNRYNTPGNVKGQTDIREDEFTMEFDKD